MKLKPKSTTKNPKALLYRRFIGLEKSENLQTVYNTTDGKFWTFDILEKKFSEISADKIPQTSKTINVIPYLTVLNYNIFFFKYDGINWIETITSGAKFNNTIEIKLPLLYNQEKEYVDTEYTPLISSVQHSSHTIIYKTPSNITYSLTIYAKNIYSGEEYKMYNKENVTNSTAVEAHDWLNRKGDSIITKIVYKAKNNLFGLGVRDMGIHIEIAEQLLITSDIELLSGTFNNIAKYQTNKYYYIGSFDFTIKGSIEGTTAQYIKGNIIPLTSLNIKYFDDDINLRTDDLVVVDGHLYSVENPETTIKQQPKPFKIHFATLNSIL